MTASSTDSSSDERPSAPSANSTSIAMYRSKVIGPPVVEVQLGSGVGDRVGKSEGWELGLLVGILEGDVDGRNVSVGDWDLVGEVDDEEEGVLVTIDTGCSVGASVEEVDGEGVGEEDGALVTLDTGFL